MFHARFGTDVIEDFSGIVGNNDLIEFSSTLFSSFAAIHTAMTQSGADVVITYDAANVLTIKNATLASLGADDFWFAP